MNTFQLIEDAFHRNIVVYDRYKEAGLSKRLLALLKTVGMRNNVRIEKFIMDEDAKTDIEEWFFHSLSGFGEDQLPKEITELVLLGVPVEFEVGLAYTGEKNDPTYLKYYESLGGSFPRHPTICDSLIIAVGHTPGWPESAILGAYKA